MPAGRASCPHCGSDAETGWREESDPDTAAVAEDLLYSDDDYADFLRREGLGHAAPPRTPPDSFRRAVVFLLVLALSGLTVWLGFLR